MAINITVVEENWFNLLEAIDDGEYDEPEQEEEDESAQDENLEATVQKELKYS